MLTVQQLVQRPEYLHARSDLARTMPGNMPAAAPREKGANALDGDAKPWTKIHGRIVDISRFQHTHPGGNIIKMFKGLDSTTAFEQFHGHHPGALKMLNVLPTKEVPDVEVPPQSEAHVAEMTRLMTDWRQRGLFEPRPIAGMAYGLAIVTMLVAMVVCSPIAPVLAGIGLGATWAHCGFLQHMGGHREWGAKYSFALQNFFEGLCKGGSASWWRNRHNKHHAKTNVIGEDGDLRTTPFFAWDPELAKKVAIFSFWVVVGGVGFRSPFRRTLLLVSRCAAYAGRRCPPC